MVAACYSLLYNFPFGLYPLIKRQSKKGSGTKKSEKLKHFSAKIQEVISNIVITEKYEKPCQSTGIPGT